LLGRHVVDGAHHHVAASELRRHQSRQSEIQYLHHAGISDEDVGRLDVAVDDAVQVREVESLADFDRDVDAPTQAHSLRRLHPREEILPLEILHREVGLTLVFAEVVDRNDVLVRELTGRSRLAEEAFAELLVLVDRRRDYLDRDDAVEERVACAIHRSHAALAQFFNKFVTTDGLHAGGAMANPWRGVTAG
jgi:hypothetical protein